jgi:hypothetical protein
MGTYTSTARTTIGTIAAASYEIRAPSTNRIYVKEIGLFLAAATAATLGVGRPAAIGVTPTANAGIQPAAHDPADAASTAVAAIAWGTAPTVPANSLFLRRIGLPATIGAGVIWTFPDGEELVIPVSGSLVVWNITAAPVIDCYFVVRD